MKTGLNAGIKAGISLAADAGLNVIRELLPDLAPPASKEALSKNLLCPSISFRMLHSWSEAGGYFIPSGRKVLALYRKRAGTKRSQGFE